MTVTSTGTASLDGLLGGHSGLALGNSLLIEESGTTDFAGALLKYYAAEGISSVGASGSLFGVLALSALSFFQNLLLFPNIAVLPFHC